MIRNLLLSLPFLLCGCANALYLYETEKISLVTVEGRPDPSQPVQLSFGAKQRVIVVAPPRKIAHDKQGQLAEAVSAISGFWFAQEPGVPGGAAGTVTIKSVIFSGEAASTLTPDEKAKVLGSIAAVEIATDAQSADNLIARMQLAGKADELKRLVTMPYDSLDPTNVKEVTGMIKDQTYTRQLHEAIAKKLGSGA